MRSFADERAHTEGGALRFLSRGPWSFRAEYDRDVSQGLARSVPTPPLTEADLAQLPAVVQRYIRLSGALGCRGSRISRPAITDKSEAGRTSLGGGIGGRKVLYQDAVVNSVECLSRLRGAPAYGSRRRDLARSVRGLFLWTTTSALTFSVGSGLYDRP
jgi:hypothetical protein